MQRKKRTIRERKRSFQDINKEKGICGRTKTNDVRYLQYV